MKLVASRHSAPAVANSTVQPSGTSATASSASAQPRARCESSGIAESAINGGPATIEHREHDRQQHLRREQPGGEHDADDHQERAEHAAGAAQQRAAEQHADDALQPVRDDRADRGSRG